MPCGGAEGTELVDPGLVELEGVGQDEAHVAQEVVAADRRRGVLRVDAVHEDAPLAPSARDAVDGAVDDLAGWLGLTVERA